MIRFRHVPELKLWPTFGLFVIALLLLDTHGLGQTSPPRARIIQRSGLPAIDRGVMAKDSREPGRRQSRAMQALQSDTRQVDRLGSAGARYLPGRVIVKFRGAMTAAGRLRAVREASRSGVVVARQPQVNFDEVRMDPGEDAEVVARLLSRRSDVEYAQPAYRVQLRFVPNDTSYAQLQWNFRAIDLERGWDIQKGATSDIVVAVLDTGVALRDDSIKFRGFAFTLNGLNYPALGIVDIPFARALDLAVAGPAGDSRFVKPFDFIWDDSDPFDLHGHGTHVSGTVGQLTDNNLGVAGIAFNAKLMPVKVVSTEWDDIFGSPNEGSDESVAEGIRYAADNGAKILNMSIGRTGGARSAPVVEEAIRYAIGKGCFIAIAGGNGFDDGNELEVYAEIASRIDGAVSVAATDRNRRRASYSTTGSWVELAAPGGSTQGFGNAGLVYQQTYDFTLTDTFKLQPAAFKPPRFDGLALVGYDGTSMATRHVAGLAALLMKQGITKPAAIEAALKHFATDLGASGRDNEFGFGEISARATLRGLGLAK